MSKEDKRKQMEGNWRRVMRFQQDAEMRRERDRSATRAQLAANGLRPGSPQVQRELEKVDAEAEKEMKKIREGANMKQLRDYWAGEDAKAFSAGAYEIAQKKANQEIGVIRQRRNVPQGKSAMAEARKQGYNSVREWREAQDNNTNYVDITGQGKSAYGARRRVRNDRQLLIDQTVADLKDDDAAMMEYYRSMFGNDPAKEEKSEEEKKKAESEQSRKEAEIAAAGGRRKGPGLSGQGSDEKNPWI
jgi:hypothetical protein